MLVLHRPRMDALILRIGHHEDTGERLIRPRKDKIKGLGVSTEGDQELQEVNILVSSQSLYAKDPNTI